MAPTANDGSAPAALPVHFAPSRRTVEPRLAIRRSFWLTRRVYGHRADGPLRDLASLPRFPGPRHGQHGAHAKRQSRPVGRLAGARQRRHFLVARLSRLCFPAIKLRFLPPASALHLFGAAPFLCLRPAAGLGRTLSLGVLFEPGKPVAFRFLGTSPRRNQALTLFFLATQLRLSQFLCAPALAFLQFALFGQPALGLRIRALLRCRPLTGRFIFLLPLFVLSLAGARLALSGFLARLLAPESLLFLRSPPPFREFASLGLRRFPAFLGQTPLALGFAPFAIGSLRCLA